MPSCFQCASESVCVFLLVLVLARTVSVYWEYLLLALPFCTNFHVIFVGFYIYFLHFYTRCRCILNLGRRIMSFVHFLGAPPDRLILQQYSSRSRSAINVTLVEKCAAHILHPATVCHIAKHCTRQKFSTIQRN